MRRDERPRRELVIQQMRRKRTPGAWLGEYHNVRKGRAGDSDVRDQQF